MTGEFEFGCFLNPGLRLDPGAPGGLPGFSCEMFIVSYIGLGAEGAGDLGTWTVAPSSLPGLSPSSG